MLTEILIVISFSFSKNWLITTILNPTNLISSLTLGSKQV